MRRQPNPIRGFLASVGLDPEILVEFQYNPDRLSDRRRVHYATVEAPGLIMPEHHYTRGGERTIRFTVTIDGLLPGPAEAGSPIARDSDGGIGPELNKYRAFLYPGTGDWPDADGSFLGLYPQSYAFTAPPACLFGFGDRVVDCIVTDVDITETLFNARLAPLRAQAAVTLSERPPYGEGAAGGGT